MQERMVKDFPDISAMIIMITMMMIIILTNKPDTITCDNEKETRLLPDITISGDRNVIKREVEKILKFKTSYSGNTAYVECKNNQKTSKQDTGKAQY
jgi:hypothetical protein